FLVSHDRAFLENTVTQVIAFEGDGRLEEFGGGYDDWQRFNEQRASQAAPAKAKPASGEASKAAPPKTTPPKPAGTRLSFKEQRELDALPGEIEALEQEQTEIQARLGDPGLYRSQPQQVKQLQSRLQQIEQDIEVAMQRWEALENRR
ncbi:MAG: ABC transporter ATP-binding protein, partial [Methylobacterium sp.]|nr:ABC transporter ATP-binding protein [Methylobacterium sp.]